MKKIFFYSLFLLCAVSATAQFKKAELQASGLTCSMCSNAINKALKTLPFIETVKTDLNKNQFDISFKDGAEVDFDAMRRKVENAGFSVAGFWVYTAFSNQKIKNEESVAFGGVQLRFINVKEQMLNGEHKIKVVDKNFVLAKELKKYTLSKAVAGANQQRVYHVTI
jgi:copper chaperone CopZ